MDKVDVAGLCPLTDEETKQIKGGSVLLECLLKFASWGAGYFFKMGVQEGRSMRALL